MSPKAKLTEEEILAARRQALKNLADQPAPGPLDKRGEFAMDDAMDRAIDAYAETMGGRGARSKAIRALIAEGAVRVLAKKGGLA